MVKFTKFEFEPSLIYTFEISCMQWNTCQIRINFARLSKVRHSTKHAYKQAICPNFTLGFATVGPHKTAIT